MNDHPTTLQLALEPQDNERLSNLCGPLEEHLHQIERQLGIEINNRGHDFSLVGPDSAVNAAEELITELYRDTANEALDAERIHLALQQAGIEELLAKKPAHEPQEVVIKTRRGMVRGRGPNQKEYLHKVVTHDINFGIGPAGTGKTFLAVACAVDALERQTARRILLVRPAVEAGEKLGFLPGDLSQKIDPYLRPLYDALYEMLGFERVHKLIERNVIEVAPLAYMRGRTLNESFIILDEAQNTTTEQMKMFLTRIGFGSTAVITGDITQVDLPTGKRSGLREAIDVLADIDDISFTFFNSHDVVRHKLVQKVIEAYEQKTDD
ncbi:phosphate starvation-inducible protein PhoH [Solemya velum gill symbiont]|uniref:PhoH family protein n=1 Tax=Solemya velum gill symbiont TaxID=2340 RepID=UPI00099864DE|nr:PhoH family protein [Solemya velum gill symbiont]OOZ45850.1 phosphate starvation-inducible protein PhoH [Solemya velum gill symbiont]OOZ50782.1 phosphate starvation-inducible protein PhoH [Solemya velum gill symbiont]OOZ57058.1 phosphate starvation-inducible protein PhoH [Solemya velum gill symbiont]OOZ62948.1 phosphate starvation-inducible protein PhoH [Solemya velum gill symbiont]OOZ65488.1 phosphate starvation-inducible protein PhoH [Solemya velum gill symbiont]